MLARQSILADSPHGPNPIIERIRISDPAWRHSANFAAFRTWLQQSATGSD